MSNAISSSAARWAARRCPYPTRRCPATVTRFVGVGDCLTKFVDLFPAECESCWKPLPELPDASAARYQQTEVPPIEPRTTEWRRHQVTCPCCGHKTRAAYDGEQIPRYVDAAKSAL